MITCRPLFPLQQNLLQSLDSRFERWRKMDVVDMVVESPLSFSSMEEMDGFLLPVSHSWTPSTQNSPEESSADISSVTSVVPAVMARKSLTAELSSLISHVKWHLDTFLPFDTATDTAWPSAGSLNAAQRSDGSIRTIEAGSSKQRRHLGFFCLLQESGVISVRSSPSFFFFFFLLSNTTKPSDGDAEIVCLFFEDEKSPDDVSFASVWLVKFSIPKQCWRPKKRPMTEIPPTQPVPLPPAIQSLQQLLRSSLYQDKKKNPGFLLLGNSSFVMSNIN
ncbi:hypothetical protein HPP92_020816 [Vanilla planifolia]|uniref:Uncharacterized protein n=1 Tax=Vanilla planifolia TaxID=51239 RepID=A0A835PVI2_VANPL|nr:hypothetical protein HPP92_020816 [Vanilla planifolia]